MSQQEIEQLSNLINALDKKLSRRFDIVEEKLDRVVADIELIQKSIGFREQAENLDGLKKGLKKA